MTPSIAPLENDSYRIRFATPGDRGAVVDFIARYWSASHAFVQYPQLFDYEHMVDGELRFVLAFERPYERLVGIQGYILCSRDDNPDVWGAIWKVADTRVPALGYRMHQYLKDAFAPGIYTGVGVNANTFGLHKKMQHRIGHLDHWYRLAARDDYRLAAIGSATIAPLTAAGTALREYPTFGALSTVFDAARFRHQRPYKDAWYIERRFFDHPAYRYRMFGLHTGATQADAVLVGREVFQNGVTALRFVDLLGDASALAGASHAIQALIDDKEYEYVDFYCHGIAPELMRAAGFVRKDPQGDNVIPNYFEPFLQKNIPLAYVTGDDSVRICKADADQDRPNSLSAAGRR